MCGIYKRAQFRSAEKTTKEWREKSDWSENISSDSISKVTHYCYRPRMFIFMRKYGIRKGQ